MTIAFLGTRGLYTRLGTIGQIIADHQTYKGTTLVTDMNNLYAQFLNGIADEQIIDGIGPALLIEQQNDSFIQRLQQYASTICTTMVQLDNPNVAFTNISKCLAEILRQMQAGSQTFRGVTVSATPTANSGNTGNGVCVATCLRSDGLTWQNVFAENIKVACISDSTSGATAGNESFSVKAAVPEQDGLAYDWPLGSGGQTSLTAISPTSRNDLIANGDFETWTSNTPASWTITVGSAGTQVLESNVAFTGSHSLDFVGDSSTDTALTQQITATNQSLYALNCWIKVDSTPAAGVLEFALVDGSGTVVNDVTGNANLFTQSLTGISTTWVDVKGIFRTPYVLPTTLKLRVRLSTALTTGHNLYLDRLCLAPMTSVYQGGPSLTVFSGSTNFLVPDGFTVAVANGRGSGGTLSTWSAVMQRLFNTNSLGLIFPYTNGVDGTISDGLI